MDKKSAQQAEPIVQLFTDSLLGAVPTSGRIGSDLRQACGSLSANALRWLIDDLVGVPISGCLDLARKAGATRDQIAYVRTKVQDETPTLLGAVLIKNGIVYMCLAYEGMTMANMEFTSRADVEALQTSINTVFASVEETAADEMDQMTFQNLVSLHAAMTFYLTETARPMPRMLRFIFSKPMPTLITAMRLYSDAGRADELRDENKVVHPAFMRRSGVALSK